MIHLFVESVMGIKEFNAMVFNNWMHLVPRWTHGERWTALSLQIISSYDLARLLVFAYQLRENTTAVTLVTRNILSLVNTSLTEEYVRNADRFEATDESEFCHRVYFWTLLPGQQSGTNQISLYSFPLWKCSRDPETQNALSNLRKLESTKLESTESSYI